MKLDDVLHKTLEEDDREPLFAGRSHASDTSREKLLLGRAADGTRDSGVDALNEEELEVDEDGPGDPIGDPAIYALPPCMRSVCTVSGVADVLAVVGAVLAVSCLGLQIASDYIPDV